MILVVGATGHLGGAIARQLLEQGNQVRILVREGSNYQPLVELGAEPVTGDLKDRASLDPACEGIHTVITTANSAGRGGSDTTESVDTGGNRNLIDAAKAAGVQHFIFISVLGVDENSSIPLFRAKALTEKHLRASGIPFTILAPNLFMEVWVPFIVGKPFAEGQPVPVVGSGNHKHTMISANDVVAYALAAVENPAAINQYIPLGGPEAISWRDAIAVYERVYGRSIPIKEYAPGEEIPGLPPMFSGLLAVHDTYDSYLDMTESNRTYGITQTTLEDVVRNQSVGA